MHWSYSGWGLYLVKNKFYFWLHLTLVFITICERLISWCHWKPWNGSVWLLASLGQLFSIWESQAHSLLRCYTAVVMWMRRASLSGSSPGPLAVATTVASSDLMEWWSFQACSATVELCSIPLWQASQWSLSLVSSLFLVTNAGLATAAGDPVHDLGPRFHWQNVLHFG